MRGRMAAVRTLGIDLAAQPKGTAACAVAWRDGGACVESLNAGLVNRDLLDLIEPVDLVGLDAPLGWPDPFVDAVRRWHEDGLWEADGDLRLRMTDRWVADRLRKQPLSVSSDRIAVAAWRAAALLTEHHGGRPVDRVHGKVREVYPAAALIRWGLPLDRTRSYKRDASERTRLLAVMTRPGWLDLGAHEDKLAASDHAFDALVCALMARAIAVDLAEPPPPDPRVAREGWIWVPREGTWDALAAGR